MERNIDIKKLLKSIKTNEFVLNCKLPMGYSYGLPLLQIRNEKLCLVIPFLKYKITGEVDKTLIFPIRNTITLSLPDEEVIGFEDLKFNTKFKKMDFNAPIGYFRPEKLKTVNKKEYNKLKDELFASYDKVINALLYDGEYSESDEARMSELLKLLIEPCLYPIYKALDADFYNKYLS